MFLEFPKDEYYQWDTGQTAKLTADAAELTEVHMHNNRVGGPALVQPVIEGENGRYVEIPDVLFARAGRLILWGVVSDEYGCCTRTEYDGINVLARAKPTDYAPGKVETLYYKALLERINELGAEWDTVMSEEVPRAEQAVKDANAAKETMAVAAEKIAAAEKNAEEAATAAADAKESAESAVERANEAVENANAATTNAESAANAANAAAEHADESAKAADTLVNEIKQKLEKGEFNGKDGADGAQGPQGEQGTDGADGKDGKTAYAYAVEGGYAGSEAEFAAKLAEKPLIGTTSLVKPAQVIDAVRAGRSVVLAHTDETYGTVAFNGFTCTADFDIVTASGIVLNSGTYEVFELYGSVSYGDWMMYVTAIAKKDDIPSALPNPSALTINGTAYDGSAAVDMTAQVNALIDTKLGVIENGTY